MYNDNISAWDDIVGDNIVDRVNELETKAFDACKNHVSIAPQPDNFTRMQEEKMVKYLNYLNGKGGL